MLFRVGLTSAVFIVRAGAVRRRPQSCWGGIGALLVAVLIGLAFATPMVRHHGAVKNESGFALVFRLGMIPMFLFCGAFFPISQPADRGSVARLR